MALSQLQSDAYRAVLRAVATTQMDWVSKVCVAFTASHPHDGHFEDISDEVWKLWPFLQREAMPCFLVVLKLATMVVLCLWVMKV